MLLNTIQLTKREQEILPLLCNALINKEIADKLSLDIKTIEKHIQNIYKKFGVNNRIGLCKRAMMEGYISYSDWITSV